MYSAFASKEPRLQNTLCSAASYDFNKMQVRDMLDKLLPVPELPPVPVTQKDRATGKSMPFSLKKTSGSLSSTGLSAIADASEGFSRDPSSPGSSMQRSLSQMTKFSETAPRRRGGIPAESQAERRRRVMDVLRQQLLQRHRSIHDAFLRLSRSFSCNGRSVARSTSLHIEDFQMALHGLGLVCSGSTAEELFAALSSNPQGTVTLTEFLHALLDAPLKVSLWELWCRLASAGVRPHNLRRTVGRALGVKWRVGMEEDAEDLSEMAPLARPDWLRFCAFIGLTLLEAERLFDGLRSGSAVDLRGMFATLRATVAPDVSLEKFAAKTLAHHGSPKAAFEVFSSEAASAALPRTMCWQQFYALAVSVEVNDSNAAHLWDVLCAAQEERHAVKELGEVTSMALDSTEIILTEDVFSEQLAIWAPDTPLESLSDQLHERFGSLAKARQALVEQGMARKEPVVLETLKAALDAVGIKCCDAERVMCSIRFAQRSRPSTDSNATLNDLINALRSKQRGGGGKCLKARSAVRNDTSVLWHQLHTVQTDLQSTDAQAVAAW